MKKYLAFAIFVLPLTVSAAWWNIFGSENTTQQFGLATSTSQQSIIPFQDSKYYLGTTTPLQAWLKVVADAFYDTDAADGCASFSSGELTSLGVPCGSGGGGSGSGTWATTTSTHSGRLINYPLNTTDIVVIGGISTTTGATEYWFDPNTQNAHIGSSLTASTTIMGNATTTGGHEVGLLGVGSDYLTDITGSGLSISSNALTCNTASGSIFGCLASADWTTFNNKESALTFSWPLIRTTNTISFGGLSTTTNSGLSQGFVYIGSGGLFQTVSTSTALSSKQDTLVSGTNIKTINGSSVLGSGDLTVTGGSGLASSTPWTFGSIVVAKDNSSVTTISTSSIKTSELTNDAGFVTSSGVTAVTGTWPIISSGGNTPAITFGGLSTTTNLTIGQIPFVSAVNKFSSRATTSVTCSGATSCSTFDVLGSSPITITSTDNTASTTLLGDTNTWSGVNRFGYASTTGISSGYASSTTGYIGTLNVGTLSGVLKGTAGLVSTAANGTDYTLISATTCGGTDKVSAISASGVVTCSADVSGTGGSSAYEISTSSNIAVPQVAYFTQTGGRTNLASVATGTVSGLGGITVTGNRYVLGGNLDITAPFAWTVNTGYNATGTALAFLNGYFSTASSTQSGNFYLPALSQGFAYVGSSGKLNTVASSSINLSSLNNDLANLTALDTTLTFSGSYNGSAAQTVGLNLGNANTWTALQTLGYSSSTIYSSFLNASSTNLFLGTGQGVLYTGSGQAVKATATSSIANGTGITVTNGSTAFVLGAQPTINCNTANASTFGCLAAADFSKFNSATTTFGSGYATTTLGTLTFSTSTASFQGATFGMNIVPTAGALTFTPTITGTLTAASSTLLTDNNTWSKLQNFAYSSSTLYSSFINASTTNLFAGFMTLSTTTSGCLNTNTSGVVYVASCATGGGVTSVGLSLPTGFTVTNSPVTTSGTLTGALQSGFSIRQLPSYVVAASGGTHTTIQGALDACGTDSGGNIYLTDATYNLGGTGLTFKGGNCHIIGRGMGTTTINFTGATTAFKTNSAVGLYANNSIEGVRILGDGNTSGVAIDTSDMSHSSYHDIQMDNVGTCFKANDTQNITFYNKIEHNTCTTITSIGFNASSTNPWNSNVVRDNFFGSNTSGVIGIQFNNANGNIFEDNRIEPGTKTNSVGIKIFDNTLATNNGVFNNRINGSYIEANDKGIQIAASVGSVGIKRNKFEDNLVDANNVDWAFTGTNATSTLIAINTFDNNMDSNFGSPLTSFQAPFGISTSTRLELLSTLPWATLAVNPTAGVAQNQFVVGSSTATNFIIKNSGFVGVGTTSPLSLLSVSGTTTLSTDYVHVGRVSCLNPLNSIFAQGLEVCGNDNTTNGVQLGVANNSAGTSAYGTIFLNNDLADNTITHRAAISLNSSKYNDTTFGTGLALPNQLMVQNTDGPLTMAISTGTPGYFNILTGGTATANERFRILSSGYSAFGTTTPVYSTLTISSSTAPQLSLSAGAGLSQWVERNAGGLLYFSTTTVAGTATSSTAALSIDSNAIVTVPNALKLGADTVYDITGNGLSVASGALGLSGPVSIANGGTNSSSLTTNTLMFYNGTSIISTSSSPLYVDALFATSTSVLSKINFGLGVATTTQWLNSAMNVVGTTTIKGQLVSLRASTTAATTQSIDWSTGNFQDIMLTAATNIVINSTSSNPIDGASYRMRICQDPTGSRTVTWANPTALRWWNGTTTVSSAANKCTMIGMIYSATNGNSIYSIVASSTGIDIK